jgi:phosphopantothenoylcysteine decarboxylase/phosphopantothenate--cysteine ligase
MQAAVMPRAATQDVVIMAAAVADFRPAERAPGKLKKEALGESPSIALVRNPDILAGLGASRAGGRPLLVGFAADTEDLVASARSKLIAKRCDLVVANDVSQGDAGFQVDTNRVVLVDSAGAEEVPFMDKDSVAHAILDRVVGKLA